MNLAKQLDTKKSKAFLYTNNESSEAEIRKKIPFDVTTTTKKIPRNKPNQGAKRSVLRKLHYTEERN